MWCRKKERVVTIQSENFKYLFIAYRSIILLNRYFGNVFNTKQKHLRNISAINVNIFRILKFNYLIIIIVNT